MSDLKAALGDQWAYNTLVVIGASCTALCWLLYPWYRRLHERIAADREAVLDHLKEAGK